MTAKPSSIFYIDFLRFIAAIAVIAIHVLGPWRYLYGEVPESEWLAAMGINSVTRWAVPVFMMISGALLLSVQKPFDCEHYLSKRVAKVVLPFIVWSVIYALVSGFTEQGWQADVALQTIQQSANDPTWYHLWFFYDFIPLYLVIPFLIPLLKRLSDSLIQLLLVSWALMLLMKWLRVDSLLLQNLPLYSGYLVLGWYLFNRDNRAQLRQWVIAGCTLLALNFFGSWELAVQAGKYQSFFMGYKTLNTMVIAGMLFVLAQTYAERIGTSLRGVISLVAKYSLGIYLVHPLILIPIRHIDNGFYDLFVSNWLAIPILTLLVLCASLFVTMLLVKIPGLQRIVP